MPASHSAAAPWPAGLRPVLLVILRCLRQIARFPLKSSFKGDVDIDVGIDIDVDVDSDMAVSVSWGVLQKRGLGAPLKGFGGSRVDRILVTPWLFPRSGRVLSWRPYIRELIVLWSMSGAPDFWKLPNEPWPKLLRRELPPGLYGVVLEWDPCFTTMSGVNGLPLKGY